MPNEKRQFTMVVEQNPKMELVCEGDPPLLLVDKDNVFYVRGGQFCSPGNRYVYFRTQPVSF